MPDQHPRGGSASSALSDELVALVERVRALPYRWPASPSASAARADGWGSCASKHALLAEELSEIGASSRPVFVVGLLVPPALADDPGIAVGADLLEVHELLTVSVPGLGPCRIDITWDPPLVHAGLAGTLEWDGRSDMAMAVGEPIAFYAPDPSRLRQEKEALRGRLYRKSDRARRDSALAAMSARFELLRQQRALSAESGRGLT